MRPRLPPEIIQMILQYLATDKETLRACSRTARDFRHVAQSFLGRHITINDIDRLKQSVGLIKRGAFQHVRSLDLGVTDKEVILEEYWKKYIVILGSFARYRALHRLWLSEVPFIFVKPSQKKSLRETVTTLGSTVNELGLYGCHFSSYEEMISLIRSFPLCDHLSVKDCITGEQATSGNVFAKLRKHKLTIRDLQLCASLSSHLLIDISNLIEDADLDIGSLTSFACDVGSSERTQRIAEVVSASPVEHFRVACSEPEGFQAFTGHFSKWTLKSLTIGPQLHTTNTEFWVEALKYLPPLPSVDNVTIAYHYPRAAAFNTDCWRHFNITLTRKDLFPALKSVHVRCLCGSRKLTPQMWLAMHNFWRVVSNDLAPSKLLAFVQDKGLTLIIRNADHHKLPIGHNTRRTGIRDKPVF